MRINVALKRYLERHIEPGLPDAPCRNGRWQYVLVIPAYDESPELLDSLSQIDSSEKVLVILVLNRPDSNTDTQINNALRNATGQLELADTGTDKVLPIFKLGASADLFCYDMEKLTGPSPTSQGVGLARKTGCDIALLWQTQGAITGNWICSTDADALLPADYFSRLENTGSAVAICFPYAHIPGSSESINQATALYELKLHHYVAGLHYAHSPYAYHTLGSCIAVKQVAYAQVRGFPRRAGGEDFYLLNKLAKLGPIASIQGECIFLASRTSHRVPFGTGPAADKIAAHGNDLALFYHPECFTALKSVLAIAEHFRHADFEECHSLLVAQGLDDELAAVVAGTLTKLGINKAIAHCRDHGKTPAQFVRQFHQWFDGFKTLKFIHAIRNNGRPMQTLADLATLQPRLLPAIVKEDIAINALQDAIRKQLKWTCIQARKSS